MLGAEGEFVAQVCNWKRFWIKMNQEKGVFFVWNMKLNDNYIIRLIPHYLIMGPINNFIFVSSTT